MSAEERDKAIKCLRQLRNYLVDDVDLKLPIHDEKFLIRFVRGKKYDAELAHKTVRKYYTLQQKNPKVSRNLYPNHEVVKQILEVGVVAVLKHRDPHGRPVLVCNIPLWDAEKFSLDNMMTTLMLIMEELMMTILDAQLNGIVVVSNSEGFSMQHAKQYSLKRIKFILDMYQGSLPLRFKGMHVVNEPAIMDIVISAARPFMTEKFKERLQFHGQNYEKLHESIPASILPEKLGGTLQDDDAYDKDFIKTLFLRDSYYQELLEYGYGNWESEDEDTYM